jgi:hypothetical protein
MLLFSVLSCEREILVENEIRYEVESEYYYPILIQWTGSDGGISSKNLIDSEWKQESSNKFSYSFKTKKKLNIFFQVENPNSLSDVKIRLYVNDELVQSAEANSQLKAIINYQL